MRYRCDAFHDRQPYELDFTVIMSPCEEPAEARRSWADAVSRAQDLPPAQHPAAPPAPAIDGAARQVRWVRRLFSRHRVIGT